MNSMVEANVTPVGAIIQLKERESAALLNAQEIEVTVELTREALSFPRTIRLGSVPNARVRVLRPIPVELSHADGSVIASVPELEEFGQGDTSSDALNDLGFSLAELFLSLYQEESRLGPDLAQLLAKLRTYLVLVR